MPKPRNTLVSIDATPITVVSLAASDVHSYVAQIMLLGNPMNTDANQAMS